MTFLDKTGPEVKFRTEQVLSVAQTDAREPVVPGTPGNSGSYSRELEGGGHGMSGAPAFQLLIHEASVSSERGENLLFTHQAQRL